MVLEGKSKPGFWIFDVLWDFVSESSIGAVAGVDLNLQADSVSESSNGAATGVNSISARFVWIGGSFTGSLNFLSHKFSVSCCIPTKCAKLIALFLRLPTLSHINTT
ncbi:hypothetical protein MKX03_015457 [Papaver bracteatum]|nr:hypothetical protein MKX03_015457 [Papaver bracteatum]